MGSSVAFAQAEPLVSRNVIGFQERRQEKGFYLFGELISSSGSWMKDMKEQVLRPSSVYKRGIYFVCTINFISHS